jgi:urea transport system substrate-binding protein
LGRKVEAVLGDGASDPDTFARVAKELITEDKVEVLFGCWTSADRKTVLPVLEQHRHLLFYPMQYEGLEKSPYVVYNGAAPNQQLIPGVKWAFDNLGTKFFLVGSDYAYPHASNAIARAQLDALGAEVVGEEYILLGSDDVEPVVEKIKKAKPDVILSTLVGTPNGSFFDKLREAGISSEETPTMSFCMAESELQRLDHRAMVGDYATWNYFQSIDSEENRAFVRRFKAKYGQDRVTDDPAESAYFGVKLWAQAVRDAESADTRDVQRAVTDQSYEAPVGIVYIDATNRHTWKPVRVGRIQEDGQFLVVWKSDKPVRPAPYPFYRSPAEWEAFLDKMYEGWGGRWHNPGSN